MVKFKKLFMGCGLTVVTCVMWLVSACSQSGANVVQVQPPKVTNSPLPSSTTADQPPTLSKSTMLITTPSTTESPAITNSAPVESSTTTTAPPVVSTTTPSETPTTTTEAPIVTTQPTTTIPFYDIDINTYLLDINGLVNTPLSLSYTQIQTYSTVTLPVEIVCPGEEDEWDNWTGVPLSTLLNVAGLSPEASEVVFTGSDGYFVDLPLSTVMEKGVFLAYQMNGQALSHMRGYPLRLVVGGSEGADWLRWVTSIQVKSNLTSFSSSAAAIQNLRGNIPISGSKTCSCLLAATVANYELVAEKEQNKDQIDSGLNLNI